MSKFEKITMFPEEIRGRFNSFIVTAFDDSLTVEMQMRRMIKWIQQNVELTNDMIDYLNEFYDTFDENLYNTTEKILEKWLADGTLAGLIDGAVLRFRDIFINVKDFGAIGDGVTDDTQSLERAFKYANLKRGRLFFPLGVYLISKTLKITNHGVSIHGVSANWSESKQLYGSVILASDCFVGEEIILMENSEFPYLRSISMQNITLRGGETSKCHGLTGVMLYDHIRFDNVQIDMIHGDYHAWNIFARGNYKQQTHVYIGCIGSKRSNINSKPTALFENLQEAVFINCKYWASLNTNVLGTANCVHLVNCGGITFETCSFVTTAKNAVYITDGKVGGGDSLTFQNCLFEECQSAFQIDVKTIKMFGEMSITVPINSKVRQGENTGYVSLSTNAGIYLYDIEGTFTTGKIYKDNGDLIGTVTKTEYSEISNLKNVHPKNTFSKLKNMRYHIANLKNSFIQTGTPVSSSESLDIKIYKSTIDTRVEIPKQVPLINESPTTKVVFLSGQESLPNLSQSSLNYLIKAVEGKEISITNPFDSEINITSFSNDTIESTFNTLFIPPKETVKFKASSDNNWNVLTFEKSYYLFETKVSYGRGVNRNSEPVKSVSVTGSIQIGRNAITTAYISSGSFTSLNLPSALQFQATPFLFISGNANTLDIVPRNGERFRGKSLNEKITINSEGKTIQIISYVDGVWDILKMS